jgi:hypothetical protein
MEIITILLSIQQYRCQPQYNNTDVVGIAILLQHSSVPGHVTNRSSPDSGKIIRHTDPP